MAQSNSTLWMVAVAGIVAGACGQRPDGAATDRGNASSAGSAPQPADPAAIFCGGVNSCKAKGECKTKKNDCTGKNECKGQGILKMSAKECASKGGTVEPSMI